MTVDATAAEARTSLGELAGLFLRLGATAFGGPAAHIALMQVEVVARRRWLSEAAFLDLLGATNLIPGPNSTELAIHIGYARRGWAGLCVAGLAFIVPAMLITWGLAWTYVRFGSLPRVRGLLYGVQPVMLAVVAQAIWALAPKAAGTLALRVLAVAALVACLVGVDELLVLFGTGAIAVGCTRRDVSGKAKRSSVAAGTSAVCDSNDPSGGSNRALLWLLPLGAAPVSPSVLGLFAVFCKIGSVLFGSGYVLLAFLRADLVERLGWLSERQLIDAIAVGQITPGPVFTTATFIGYVLAGGGGALSATAGIFLPAFVFVALSGPFVPRLRGSAGTAAFLDGVNVASLALMAAVTVQLAGSALVDLPAVGIVLVAALLLIRFKINSTWVIAGGATAGLLLHVL